MLDPPVFTDIILATLALYSMVCNSPNKSLYCPLGLVDSESSDRDIIHGSCQNDNPGESMYLI